MYICMYAYIYVYPTPIIPLIIQMLLILLDSESYLELSLGVESIKNCSFLRAFNDLRRLHLNVNKLSTLQGLEGLYNLHELSVKDNAINDLEALKDLKSLRSLRLDDNLLTAEGLSCLKHHSLLNTLSVSTNKLQTLPILTGCHSLQRLELYHNNITHISPSSLAALISLTHLDLGRNKLETISGSALSQCHVLQTLVLSQNLLTSPPSPLYLPNLRNLWLSGNKLKDLDSWLPYSSVKGRLLYIDMFMNIRIQMFIFMFDK
jgi:Leucine-rich repeat (LRR) protein